MNTLTNIIKTISVLCLSLTGIAYASSPAAQQPLSISYSSAPTTVGSTVLLRPNGGSGTGQYHWEVSGPATLDKTTGDMTSVSFTDAGTVDVVLTHDADANFAAAIATTRFNVSRNTGVNNPPKTLLITQPLTDKIVDAGSTVTLSITVSGVPAGASYHWKRNNFDIVGANTNTLSLINVSSIDDGLYTCYILTGDFVLASSTGMLAVNHQTVANADAKFVNISTRSWVDAGEKAQIAGLVIGGTGLKTVLVRASGPALADFGVGSTVSDPILTVYDAKGNALFVNDNWNDGLDAESIPSTASSIGAFAFKAGSKDAALLLTLPAGAYTVVVTPKAGTNPGVGLVEVYEVK